MRFILAFCAGAALFSASCAFAAQPGLSAPSRVTQARAQTLAVSLHDALQKLSCETDDASNLAEIDRTIGDAEPALAAQALKIASAAGDDLCAVARKALARAIDKADIAANVKSPAQRSFETVSRPPSPFSARGVGAPGGGGGSGYRTF